MKINWKVRLKNKNFWIALIPTVLLLVKPILELFGVDIDLGEVGNALLSVVDGVFVLMAVLGIITDPTTAGMSDSELALTYDKPKK
jgi:phi LC3 family holin